MNDKVDKILHNWNRVLCLLLYNRKNIPSGRQQDPDGNFSGNYWKMV